MVRGPSGGIVAFFCGVVGAARGFGDFGTGLGAHCGRGVGFFGCAGGGEVAVWKRGMLDG